MNAEFDIANNVLITERLILRPFKHCDSSDFNIADIDDVTRLHHLGIFEEKKKIVDGLIAENNAFVVVYNDNVIGYLGIYKCDITVFPEIDKFKCGELKFSLSKDCLDSGLMVEAVNRVVGYAFEVIGCDCLISSSHKGNVQSTSIQHECGFNDFKPFVDATNPGMEKPSIWRILWNSNVPLSERIYAYLRMLPKGKVATYGQVAEYLGDKHLARVVGNILHVNPDPDANPCFRIVNSEGHLARHFGAPGGIENQRARMEADGIEVRNYRVDLKAVQFYCE